MDGAKTVAKVVVAAGLVSVWAGAGPGWASFGPLAWAPWIRAAPDVVGVPVLVDPVQAPSVTPLPAPSDVGWFQRAKPYCNAVEVTGYLRANPFPGDWDGSAHGAACLALAGQIDEARGIIEGLSGDQQWQAVGVVFEAGHPAADAGDDVAAGPLMELVVEFWPNHYMALYHAGASRYQRGDEALGRHYLERFLESYDLDDGWTRNARAMLAGSALRPT